jgi:hypothetical protein
VVQSRLQQTVLALAIGSLHLWWASAALAVDADAIRNHAEQPFNQPTHPERTPSSANPALNGQTHAGYSPDQYVIGVGQGDMTKGAIVCQRVSELSARTDLAKQIRILVKEHMVDRIREHSGKDADQEIEVTREEIVQEYLQGVKIIDRQVDQEKNICTATAVMPRSKLQITTPSSDPLPLAPITR